MRLTFAAHPATLLYLLILSAFLAVCPNLAAAANECDDPVSREIFPRQQDQLLLIGDQTDVGLLLRGFGIVGLLWPATPVTSVLLVCEMPSCIFDRLDPQLDR